MGLAKHISAGIVVLFTKLGLVVWLIRHHSRLPLVSLSHQYNYIHLYLDPCTEMLGNLPEEDMEEAQDRHHRKTDTQDFL